MVPKELRPFLDRLPESIMGKTEDELRHSLKPDDMLCRLRISFWDEYQRAHNTGGTMVLENIIRGCCSEEYFLAYVAIKHEKLRWIIEVPKDYYLAMREMLDLGLSRLRDILKIDFMEDVPVRVGKEIEYVKRANPRIMAEIRTVVQLLDQRVKGAIVQKLAIKQESVNYNVDSGNMSDMNLQQLEALEKRLSGMTDNLNLVQEKGVVLEVNGTTSQGNGEGERGDGSSEKDCIAEDTKEPYIC